MAAEKNLFETVQDAFGAAQGRLGMDYLVNQDAEAFRSPWFYTSYGTYEDTVLRVPERSDNAFNVYASKMSGEAVRVPVAPNVTLQSTCLEVLVLPNGKVLIEGGEATAIPFDATEMMIAAIMQMTTTAQPPDWYANDILNEAPLWFEDSFDDVA